MSDFLTFRNYGTRLGKKREWMAKLNPTFERIIRSVEPQLIEYMVGTLDHWSE